MKITKVISPNVSTRLGILGVKPETIIQNIFTTTYIKMLMEGETFDTIVIEFEKNLI